MNEQSMHDAVKSEVTRRIAALSTSLGEQLFYAFQRKKELRRAIDAYENHLRGLNACDIVNKIFGIEDKVRFDQNNDGHRAQLDFLASPAMSDS